MRFSEAALRRWLIFLGVVLGLLLVVGLFRDDRAGWYTGIAALYTFAALVAALVAVALTWPQYQQWRTERMRVPIVRLSLQTAETVHQVPVDVGETIYLEHESIILRVVITNAGTGALRSAMLNIVVPLTCRIEPLDPEPKQHYLSVLPSRSNRMTDDGSLLAVRFSVARFEVVPGDHVFHARLSPIGDGP